MCATCGCSGDEHDHDHHHDHSPGPPHEHFPRPPQGGRLRLDQEVLAKNNRLAERNRGWLAGRDVRAVNLMSSPGSGKTTLLERTLRDLGDEMPLLVIEGDQATTRDAERIRAAGGRVVQINTGTGCHLDADMVAGGLEQLAPPAGGVVLIENVGNLVCPALFDLGEQARVLIMAITEGEDKPLKYPTIFNSADLAVVTKIDLAEAARFEREQAYANLRAVRPGIEILETSARTGAGVTAWLERLAALRDARGPRR